MSKVRTKHNFKTLIVSIVAVLALVCSAVLSFGVYDKKIVNAEEEINTDEIGLRFVQVAAGEDFAIGLTYDGQLYGWSLLTDGNAGKMDESTAKTLGQYYPTKPTKINFEYKVGPGTSSPINTWDSSDYKKTDTNERYIVQIAATRTTAAFIASNGFIYTWGIDTAKDIPGGYTNGTLGNYLLLRNPDSTGHGGWSSPYIINYGYYDGEKGKAALSTLALGCTNDFSIAAGENNYVVVYKNNSNYYSFVWGSILYATAQGSQETYDFVTSSNSYHQDNDTNRTIYTVSTSNDSKTYKAVAGGYTVGVNANSSLSTGNSSLMLRGRNFITTKGVSGSSNSYTIEKTTNSASLSEIEFGDSTYADAIIGGASAQNADNNGIRGNDSGYYGVQSANFVYATGGTFTNSGITSASGESLGKDNASVSKIILNAVSLGNDVGYGISGNKLYAWGDNKYGQLGVNNSSTTNSATPTQIITNKTNVISVAAGKQLSSSEKAFTIDNTFNTGSTNFADGTVADGSGTKHNVLNDKEYISGALSGDGELYVWSDVKTAPQIVTIGKNNDTNKFVAIYSGYGHNLFAITKLGKIVRISINEGDSNYALSLYDEFKDAQGNDVTNWTTAENGSNVVKVAGLESQEDTHATFTLYVNNAISNKNSTKLNDGVVDEANTAMYYNKSANRGSLVTLNNSGDRYRILSSEKDTAITYLSDDNLSSSDLTPTFYFKAKGAEKSVLMTTAQISNMFDWTYDYSTTYGVGIKISPKQSSKLGTVTVKFHVARYDSKSNYSILVDGNVTDTAQYFDHKECSVDFVIDNTNAYKTFSAFRDSGSGNANVPLLDPNNSYNKNYSLAVQDVSSGITALSTYLSVGNAVALESVMRTKMIAADNGYPDSSKIASGNLEYYLGSTEASRAYSNSYQYLFTDVDGDVIKIDPNAKGGLDSFVQGGATTDSVTSKVNEITISLTDLANYKINKSVMESFYTDFNNLYGIYDVKYTTDESSYVSSLSFKYSVVTFTAVKTTGKLDYNGESASVDAYKTLSTGAYVRFNVTNYYEYIKRDANYKPDLSVNTSETKNPEYVKDKFNNCSGVFAQSTLRLKNQDAYKVDGSIAYGDNSAGKNDITIKFDKEVLNVGSTKTINLNDYIDSRSDYITFTYANKRDFADFNSQFPDGNVILSETSISVKPIRAYNIYFAVTIQRLYGDDKKAFANGDECITIHFAFTNIKDVTITPSAGGISGATKALYSISRVSTFDLWGNSGSINQGSPLLTGVSTANKALVTVSRPSVNETSSSILTATLNEDGQSFTITPVESGVAIVQFYVSLYDKRIAFTLTFNVSAVTTVKDGNSDYVLAIADTKNVFVSKLKTALINSVGNFNSSVNSYAVLYNDLSDSSKPNAIYFTEWDDSTKTEGGRIDGYPSYIKSISFQDLESDDKMYIRIELDSEQSDMSGVYKMHVRFVNKNDGYATYAEADAAGASILETAFIVKSTKQIATENGSMLNIGIDVDGEKSIIAANPTSDWYMTGNNLNATITIPLKYLFEKANLLSDTYKIFLVSAADEAATYINYTFDDEYVYVTPLYDTPDDMVITLNVSASSTKSSNPNRVIAFTLTVKGISTTLTKQEYTTIWIVAFFSTFGLLFIIFIIRLIVYWRRRAKQRELIKRNQELIKMRDRLHNRTTSATREQVVKTRLKMNNPKYAKMLNDVKSERNEATMGGITLENADFGISPEPTDKKSKKKKKGGKKSLEELKAELAAKKAAFAQAQSGVTGMPDMTGMNGMGGDMYGGQSGYAAPFASMPVDDSFVTGEQGFGSPADGFSQADLDGNAIIFDATDDGMQG